MHTQEQAANTAQATAHYHRETILAMLSCIGDRFYIETAGGKADCIIGHRNGCKLSVQAAADRLRKLGVQVRLAGGELRVFPPKPYRKAV